MGDYEDDAEVKRLREEQRQLRIQWDEQILDSLIEVERANDNLAYLQKLGDARSLEWAKRLTAVRALVTNNLSRIDVVLAFLETKGKSHIDELTSDQLKELRAHVEDHRRRLIAESPDQ